MFYATIDQDGRRSCVFVPSCTRTNGASVSAEWDMGSETKSVDVSAGVDSEGSVTFHVGGAFDETGSMSSAFALQNADGIRTNGASLSADWDMDSEKKSVDVSAAIDSEGAVTFHADGAVDIAWLGFFDLP